MQNNTFSPMEMDAIGEIMNISLGSSATAISNMLDHRVDITTPTVSVVDVDDFSLGEMDPALGVEIKYVSGLKGSNIMLLKLEDIKVIVDILMGSETPAEEFELNELTVSAVCEVMNQMMGAASTALSDFLGRLVNISPPESFELNDFQAFKDGHFPVRGGPVVVVRFALQIEDVLKSEFLNIMSVDLARLLLSGMGLEPEQSTVAPLAQPQLQPEPVVTPTSADGVMSQADIEQLLRQVAQEGEKPSAPPAPAPAPSAQTTPPPAPQAPAMDGPVYPPEGYMPPYGYGYPGQVPPYYPGPYYTPPAPAVIEPKVIETKPVTMPALDPQTALSQEQAQNLDLIMNVPLEVTVEIGRTRRKVQDILAFSKGSLVVLDKLAGDQVDLFVNGKCIARGDVVVMDDNFGIRITEILQQPSLV